MPPISKKNDLPPELGQLEEVVGNFIQYWGFKKIHGRIWTHLYLSTTPLDSIELIKRLRVSKALMSLAIRDLIEFNVIIQDHVGKHGSVFYQANRDLFGVISHVLRIRESKMLAVTQLCIENLQKLSPSKLASAQLNPKHIEDIGTLTTSAQSLLEMFLNQNCSQSFDLFSSGM